MKHKLLLSHWLHFVFCHGPQPFFPNLNLSFVADSELIIYFPQLCDWQCHQSLTFPSSALYCI